MAPKLNLLETFLEKGKSVSHRKLWFNLQRKRGKYLDHGVWKPSAGTRHRRKVKREVITAYGGGCNACGERDPATLSIDHIFDDGAEERRRGGGAGRDLYTWLRRHGFPKDRYQLLCMNCQYRKRNYGPDFTSWPKY